MKPALTILTVAATIALALSSTIVEISFDEVKTAELDEPQTIDIQPQPSYHADQKIFDTFLADFDIELDSSDSYGQRLGIFMENYRKILAHNERFYQGVVSFEMAVNQFTHLTEVELMNYVSQVDPVEATNFSLPVYQMAFNDFMEPAASVNWVERNSLQPIQNQGACGSCYVFAGIATIEAQMIIHNKGRQKLSEQEAMECTRGCHGGWSQDVYRYSHQHHGCTSFNACPYQAHTEQSCSAANRRPRVPNSAVRGIYTTGTSERNTLKALDQYGPVTAYFAVYPSFMGFHGGVYHRTADDSRILGYHAITFVGYGEQHGQKYWLIRNSWGTRWGEQGYGKFIRGRDDCRIESLNHFGPAM